MKRFLFNLCLTKAPINLFAIFFFYFRKRQDDDNDV